MSDKSMKNYIVTLNMQIGGFEKLSRTLIEASDEISAAHEALLGECHNHIGDGAEWLEEDEQVEDDYGGMIYTLHDVKPVCIEDYEIIKKYF